MPDGDIDLRAAINAISDVVQNRPRPLREFDQIYMKTADMVLQSELVARWADGKRLAFIGDGDAISVCVPYLRKRGILDYGPREVALFDFDERICNAVQRFAEREELDELRSDLYNCLDAFPTSTGFDCFYTNPPWGASNDGASVNVFVQRGIEATGFAGEGLVVVADDPELEWPKRVLASLQQFCLESGYFVARMMPEVHSYHLDDAPNLRSCNVLVRSLPANARSVASQPIRDPDRLANFYGRDNEPRVHYIREQSRLDYGKAHESEYTLEPLEGEDD